MSEFKSDKIRCESNRFPYLKQLDDPTDLSRFENTIILPSGIHSFPFKLGLPTGIPSTFVGKHGWVCSNFCKFYLITRLTSC